LRKNVVVKKHLPMTIANILLNSLKRTEDNDVKYLD